MGLIRFGGFIGGRKDWTVRPRGFATTVTTVGVFFVAAVPTLQAQRLPLEDAPSAIFLRSLEQAAPQATSVHTGAIYGEVLDVNQGIVPGAKVVLQTPREVSDQSLPPEREVISDSEGRFRFAELPAGKYVFTISSAGLETFVSLEITLREGQQHEVPKIALPIASASSDVTVRVTQRQLADEQIEAEMHQRVFGLIPNFYSSYVWDAAPLEPKQKFKMAVRSRSDPFVFVATAVVAGIQQARNSHKGYGQGAEGYAKRYGAAFATGTLSRFLGSAVYPAIFHQDPRYFYKGTGSVGSRAWYAMTRSVVARGDNGKWQPNYSHILGGMTAGAISNLYYPDQERGVRLTFENAALGIAFTGVGNLVREFGLRHVTHGVPSFSNGQRPITDK